MSAVWKLEVRQAGKIAGCPPGVNPRLPARETSARSRGSAPFGGEQDRGEMLRRLEPRERLVDGASQRHGSMVYQQENLRPFRGFERALDRIRECLRSGDVIRNQGCRAHHDPPLVEPAEIGSFSADRERGE